MDSIAYSIGVLYNDLVRTIGAYSLVTDEILAVGYIFCFMIILPAIGALIQIYQKKQENNKYEMKKTNSNHDATIPILSNIHLKEDNSDIDKTNSISSQFASHNGINPANKIVAFFILIILASALMIATNPGKKEFSEYLLSPERIRATAESVGQGVGGFEELMIILQLAVAVNNSDQELKINTDNYKFFSLFTVDLNVPENLYGKFFSKHYLGIFGMFFPVSLEEDISHQQATAPERPQINNDSSQAMEASNSQANYDRALEEEARLLPARFQEATKTGRVSCDEINNSNHKVEYMEKIHELAKLSSEYFNRYHEAVVYDYCHNDIEGVHKWIDSGYVTEEEVIAISKVLGKAYQPRERSADGIKYEKIYKQLLGLDLCTACASNAALAYVNEPGSACAKVVEEALQGNSKALEIVQQLSNPENCHADGVLE